MCYKNIEKYRNVLNFLFWFFFIYKAELTGLVGKVFLYNKQ